MKRDFLKPIRCPMCGEQLKLTDIRLESIEVEEASLVCEKGHHWEIIDGIPQLVHPPISEEDMKWIREYDEMAPKYDELVLQYNDFLGIDVMKEREQIGIFIPHEGPVKLLEISTGTGANIEAIHNYVKGKTERLEIHALDLSEGMLAVAKDKMKKLEFSVGFTHASVFNLPYSDNFFDIVLHSGGLNTFSDISKALEEMFRVTCKGGTVIVIDEGMSPKMRETERGKAIIAQNNLFSYKPPLDKIPDAAQDVEVTYVMGETFYQVVFKK